METESNFLKDEIDDPVQRDSDHGDTPVTDHESAYSDSDDDNTGDTLSDEVSLILHATEIKQEVQDDQEVFEEAEVHLLHCQDTGETADELMKTERPVTSEGVEQLSRGKKLKPGTSLLQNIKQEIRRANRNQKRVKPLQTKTTDEAGATSTEDFRCQHDGCKKTYTCGGALRAHIRVKHKDWSLRCTHPGCDRVFPLQNMLSKHQRTHTTTVRAYCCPHEFCMKNFKTVEEARRHSKVHKEVRAYSCVIQDCHLTFNQPKAVDTHIKLAHPSEQSFRCSEESCGKSYESYVKLRKHQEIHCKDREFVCSVQGCGKAFGTAYYLKSHTWKCHSAKKSIPCELCGKVFRCKSDVKKHMLTHTKPHEKDFLCTDCGKRFASQDLLKRHQTSHSDDRPFLCTECGVSFKRREALNKHVERHQKSDSPTPYTGHCPHCGIVTKTAFALSAHIRSHFRHLEDFSLPSNSSQAGYVCSQPNCGKTFKLLKYLKEHELIHSNEAHVCSYCGKVFKCFRYLKCHQKTHTDERKYTCSFCGKTFKTIKELTRHTETHSDTRNYICPVANCGRSYKTASTLRSHLRIHKRNEELNRDFRPSSFFN